MLCYRDMTFCSYDKCAEFSKCVRALNDEVKEGAKRWMGENAPICQFAEKPECFAESE